jgi:hypothetical protein
VEFEPVTLFDLGVPEPKSGQGGRKNDEPVTLFGSRRNGDCPSSFPLFMCWRRYIG